MKLTTLIYMLIGFAALIYATHLFAPQGIVVRDAHHTTHNDVHINNAIQPHKPVTCDNQLKQIRAQMTKKAECWVNEDCKIVRFGCPYQDNPCRFFMLGKDDTKRNTALKDAMLSYQSECLKKSDATAIRLCKAFQKEAALVDCRDPRSIALLCINGECKTRTESMIQFDDDGGVDGFGSSEVISAE